MSSHQLDMESGTYSEYLRSRVDQQSSLIAMLKQRGDNTLLELTESREKCELLTSQVDSLQERLVQEQSKLIKLEQKFSILANNHEEMIRIKDEYKQMNKHLLAEHKASVICLKCEQLKEELALSELAVSNLKEKNEAFKTSSSELQTLIPLLENQLREVNEATKEKEKCLLEKLIEMEKKACVLESQCNKEREDNKISTLQIQQYELDKENQEKKLKACQNSLSSCEKELKHFQEREQQSKNYSVHIDEVSKDVTVRQVSRDLAEANEKLKAMEKEYSAYKNHSSQLLTHERELNSKLRHLLD